MQVEHFPNEILVHQSRYTEEVLKHFYMNKTYPLITPMIDWSFNVKKNHFRHREEYKEIYDFEVPYISAIDTMMYFANYT